MKPWVEEAPAGGLDGVHGGPGPGGDDPDVIDFSVNVNPFAPAPRVVEAWKSVAPWGYPDPASLDACAAAARLWHLARPSVRFGAGATALLHRAALAWLSPGEAGVVAEPGFAEYGRAVALARGRLVSVPPSDADGSLDLDGFVAACRDARAGIAYIGRPNTPTGESVPVDALLRVRAALPQDCLLVLDESFVSFDEGSVAAPPALGIRDGVLSIRSVTKDCGLAGLRAGFAVGPDRVLRALDQVSLPWSASTPAQVAARVSLEPDSVAYLNGTLARVRAELERLSVTLAHAGLPPRPSRANFLCVGTPRANAIAGALERRGLRLRRCGSFGLSAHLRIGVRHPGQNARLVTALGELACA